MARPITARKSAKRVWITWERHRRTTGLAASLRDIRLFELELDAHRLIRYAYLLSKTSCILAREKPRLVIVQNPSVLLALFMVTFGRLFTSKIVVDAHNEGLMPFYHRYRWLLPVYRFIQRRSDLTIVTNVNLATQVEDNGGNPFVLEDRVPEFIKPSRMALRGEFNVAYVCTFEKDEPFKEVLRAARLLNPGIFIYVTGNHKKVRNIAEKTPENVVFTGFLTEKQYIDLLFSCDAVMDLTWMEDCLVCGAYEAVALEKPLILSRNKATRDFFHAGTVYTDNHPPAIAESVGSALENLQKLKSEIGDLKKTLTANWKAKLKDLNEKLSSMASV